MFYKKILGFITCIALLLPLMSFADGDAGYAGAFLRMGVDARTLSMGNVGTGIVKDATATYWNPAGLGYSEKTSISCMHSLMTLDRGYNFFSLAQNVGPIGTFGISWLGFGVGKIDGRDGSGNPTSDLTDSENAFLLSYARKITPFISIGGNLKFLYQTLASHHATGLGVDIGLMGSILDFIPVGFVIQDIGSSLKWNTESGHKDNIPPNIRLGAGIEPPGIPLVIATDIEKNIKQGIKFHIGAEYTLLKMFSLRAGYGDGNFGLGVGFKVLMLNLDYGVSLGNELGTSQRISLSMNR
ncbi:PorV/PorQ family protein [candidate division WOR-3 bacterium]|nr:PorV/PorQ family protein [candidate division WOR-3 bacterium]